MKKNEVSDGIPREIPRMALLIVDDVEINRSILKEMLSEQYDIFEAEDGGEVLPILSKNKNIGAVLLDIFMPKVDGFEVLKKMSEKGYLRSIPVLIITAETSSDIEQKGYEMGAADIIRKPFGRYVKRRVQNITELYYHKKHLENLVDTQTRELKKKNEALRKQAAKLKQTNSNIVATMSNIIEFRDAESGTHIKRMKVMTQIIATVMKNLYPQKGLTAKMVQVIVDASPLHDIGKIAIPDSILLKPGRLTSEEFEIMKTHTVKGSEMVGLLSDIQNPEYNKVSYEIARYHHERYNGKGYPEGLKGDEIPISAQIVSIADVYDALVNVRCYKKAYSKEEAYNMIYNGECGVFSPELLNCLKEAKSQVESIY